MTKCDCTRSASNLINNFAIQHSSVTKKGINIPPKWLKGFNFKQNSEFSMLILPGYMVVTNQTEKEQCLQAIEELQHREFELGRKFTAPVAWLVRGLRDI